MTLNSKSFIGSPVHVIKVHLACEPSAVLIEVHVMVDTVSKFGLLVGTECATARAQRHLGDTREAVMIQKGFVDHPFDLAEAVISASHRLDGWNRDGLSHIADFLEVALVFWECVDPAAA